MYWSNLTSKPFSLFKSITNLSLILFTGLFLPCLIFALLHLQTVLPHLEFDQTELINCVEREIIRAIAIYPVCKSPFWLWTRAKIKWGQIFPSIQAVPGTCTINKWSNLIECPEPWHLYRCYKRFQLITEIIWLEHKIILNCDIHNLIHQSLLYPIDFT